MKLQILVWPVSDSVKSEVFHFYETLYRHDRFLLEAACLPPEQYEGGDSSSLID